MDIVQIEAPKGSDEARLAVEIRNALLFDFSGGGSAAPPTHRLKIAISSTRAAIIVDVNTSRPDIENYGINATYSLTEIATAKVVVTGQTFAWVSYDIPGKPLPGCPTTSQPHGRTTSKALKRNARVANAAS